MLPPLLLLASCLQVAGLNLGWTRSKFSKHFVISGRLRSILMLLMAVTQLSKNYGKLEDIAADKIDQQNYKYTFSISPDAYSVSATPISDKSGLSFFMDETGAIRAGENPPATAKDEVIKKQYASSLQKKPRSFQNRAKIYVQ